MKAVLFSILPFLAVSSIVSIECKFFFSEITLEEIANDNEIDTKKIENAFENAKNQTYEPFECNQNLSNGVKEENFSTNDDYDESECQAQKRTYIPKELRNIHNELKTIFHDVSHIQRVTIDECLELGKPCTGGSDDCICNQAYVKMAYLIKDIFDNDLRRDEFYIPSNCICEDRSIAERKAVEYKAQLQTEAVDIHQVTEQF